MTNTPWLDEAEKNKGKKETDSKWSAYLSGFWARLGLPQFKTIVGSAHAWCGLFVGAMLAVGGMAIKNNGASAIAWDSYGQKIEWKVSGIPRGAIVRINHKGACNTYENDHVTFSDGDCTALDVKSGSFNGLGGNQGDQVKVSAYPMADICAVRWPAVDAKGNKIALPVLPVAKSNGCKGEYKAESTR